ncbi:MAG: hypothetical protein DRR42_03565 [Gammaproteobacteria bacterium]|nr:MAG: hypothetical protein DRR42_03565 [Gammaproteobacteria bacterium]
MAIEPAAIPAGPVVFVPQISLQEGYDDNLFTTKNNKKDSFITIIKPSIQMVAENQNDTYRLTYILEHGIYQDSNSDNYTDYDLLGEAIMELNSRNRLNLSAAYIKNHEARGSTNAASGNKPSRFTDKAVKATYRYGAKTAKTNVELVGAYLDRDYTNLYSVNRGRDRDNTLVGGTIFYRVAPKTSALAEVRHEDIDYDLSSSTEDSTEEKYYVGATWEATAKTSGTAKFGYSKKDFDDSEHDNQDGPSWEVGVKWAPRTYSVFDLKTAQEFKESDGVGSAIDADTVSLAWTHSWNKRVSTNAMIRREKDDYIDFNRDDDIDSLKVGISYEMRRWLSLGLGYQYTDTSSNISVEEYSRNQFVFTLKGSL